MPADHPRIEDDHERGPVGAYGLRVEGVSDAVRRWLGPADPTWEPIELRAGIGQSDEELAEIKQTRATVPLPNRGEIVIERSPLVAEVRLPLKPPREEELLHPYLGYVAAIVALWAGRESVHAGGLAVEGGVWGLIGRRTAGKSSMLGWLATQGHDIVCDDVLVIEDGKVLAGPRFVDLRAEAAESLRTGTPIGEVGARERWRLEVGSVPSVLPLRGWVFLDWGPEIEVVRVSAAQCLLTIKDQMSLFGAPRDAASLLGFASLPAWQLRRPQSWESMADASRRLLDALSS